MPAPSAIVHPSLSPPLSLTRLNDDDDDALSLSLLLLHLSLEWDVTAAMATTTIVCGCAASLTALVARGCLYYGGEVEVKVKDELVARPSFEDIILPIERCPWAGV